MSNFIIFSPDEAESNGFKNFIKNHYLRWTDEDIDSSIPIRQKGKMIDLKEMPLN